MAGPVTQCQAVVNLSLVNCLKNAMNDPNQQKKMNRIYPERLQGKSNKILVKRDGCRVGGRMKPRVYRIEIGTTHVVVRDMNLVK